MEYKPLFEKQDDIPSKLYNNYYLGGDKLGEESNPCSLCRDPDTLHFHGSDLAACQKRIYLQKLRSITLDTRQKNNFLLDGHLHEKSILDYIGQIQSDLDIYSCVNEKEYQRKIKFDNNEKHSFILVGHPDAICAINGVENSEFIIECKAVSETAYKTFMDNIIPDSYYGQIQTYMFLLGVKVAYLIVKNRNNSQILMPFRFEYNEEYVSQRLQKLREICNSLILQKSSLTQYDFEVKREHNNPKDTECKFCAFQTECWG